MSKINVLHECGPSDTPVTLHVNGKSALIPNNTETAIPALFHDAALNCGYPIQILGESDDAAEDEAAPTLEPAAPVGGEGDGDPGGDGGTDPAGATFDPEAVILGTVAEVAAKLKGLTAEQLTAVAAAELDREKPREGVKAAIEAASKAFNEAPAA